MNKRERRGMNEGGHERKGRRKKGRGRRRSCRIFMVLKTGDFLLESSICREGGVMNTTAVEKVY